MKPEQPHALRAVGETVTRAADLVQVELRLFKAEMVEKMTQLRSGLAIILAGAMLVTAALFLLLQSVALLLVAAGLSAIGATLLVAVVTIVIGVALMAGGRKQIDADELVPDRTLNDIKRDSVLVKEKLS